MRSKEIEVANWLQDVLGENYAVRYDDCESCITRVVFKPLNKVVAEVPNSEMHTGISVQDFEASKEDMSKAVVLGLLK